MPRPHEILIAKFVDEECEFAPGTSVTAGTLYAQFVAYCNHQSVRVLSQRMFGMTLTKMGLAKDKYGRRYLGVRLKPLT